MSRGRKLLTHIKKQGQKYKNFYLKSRTIVQKTMEMLIRDPSLEVFLCIKSREREPNIPLKPMYVMSHSENPGALIDEAIVRGQDKAPGTFTYGHNIQKEYQEDIFDTQNKPHSGETEVYLITNRERGLDDEEEENVDNDETMEEEEEDHHSKKGLDVLDGDDFYLGAEPRPPRLANVNMEHLQEFGDSINPVLLNEIEERRANEKKKKGSDKKKTEKLAAKPYESIKGKTRIPRPDRGPLFAQDLKLGNLDQIRQELDNTSKTVELGEARKRGKPKLFFKMKGAKSVVTIFDKRVNSNNEELKAQQSEDLVLYEPIVNTFEENISSEYY